MLELSWEGKGTGSSGKAAGASARTWDVSVLDVQGWLEQGVPAGEGDARKERWGQILKGLVC